MTAFLGVDDNYTDQTIRLLTDVQGNPLQTRAQAISTATAWDHIVYSQADLPPEVAGVITLTSGSWAFAASMTLSGYLLCPFDQTIYIQGMGWDKVVTVNGGLCSLEIQGPTIVKDLALVNVGSRTVRVTHANADCILWGTKLTATLENLWIADGKRVSVVDGLWNAGTDAVSIIAGVGLLSLQHIESVAQRFLYYSGGVVTNCLMSGCQVEVDTGIDWAAGSIPVNGLSVVNNHIDFSVAPFNGHNQASARCNYKGNTVNTVAALLSETAIVP